MIKTKFYFFLLSIVHSLKILVAGDQNNDFYEKLATSIAS